MTGTRLPRPPCRVRTAGFNLVELLVSITISLVILAALVAVFVNTSRGNRELERANSVIENGRLAIQLLEHDVVHAGYWGGHVPGFDDQTFTGVPPDAPTFVPDPCLPYSATNWDLAYLRNLLAIPVQAYAAAPVGTCSLPSLLPDNDVLLVRHAGQCAAGTANCEPVAAGTLYLQVSRCLTDTTGVVFATAGHTLRQRNCATLAERRPFTSNIYWIRDYSVAPGDGIPTLMRSQFDPAPGVLAHQASEALIEGIERFRVELGLDDVSETGAAVDNAVPIAFADPTTRETPTNRGDGRPDGNFLRCTVAAPCTATQLANITAVKLYVLARSREPSQGHVDSKVYDLGGGVTAGPFNDAFKRHVFISSVRLNNVSARRETP